MAQMKDVGERIGNLPALGQPRLQLEVIVAPQQSFEDQLADALRLGIGPDARIEVERRALDQHRRRCPAQASDAHSFRELEQRARARHRASAERTKTGLRMGSLRIAQLAQNDFASWPRWPRERWRVRRASSGRRARRRRWPPWPATARPPHQWSPPRCRGLRPRCEASPSASGCACLRRRRKGRGNDLSLPARARPGRWSAPSGPWPSPARRGRWRCRSAAEIGSRTRARTARVRRCAAPACARVAEERGLHLFVEHRLQHISLGGQFPRLVERAGRRAFRKRASITMLPGPVSNARTCAASAAAGIAVRLPMPPRFSTMRPRLAWRKTSRSRKGTSGAPSPPAAISAGRKSLTTGIPSRAASTEPSPICQVQAILRPRNRSCLALVIERLPVASHQLALDARAPLQPAHAIGINFRQQKVQPRQRAHRNRVCVHGLAARRRAPRQGRETRRAPAVRSGCGSAARSGARWPRLPRRQRFRS